MKISIITVCLNSERTIEKTINSVLGQSDSNYEYIIIDGKSTDGTLEIINRYRDRISIVISEPDKGIYDAMNKGVARATGDIIGIINSDDWYEPGVLGLVRKSFQISDADIVYGEINLIAESGKVKHLIPGNIEKIRYEMAIPHPAVFIKKGIYEKYGAFNLKYKIAADYELMLRLYTKGVRFFCQNHIFANFRLGGFSECQNEKCIKETLQISQEYLSYTPLEKRRCLKEVIMHRYQTFCFEQMMKEVPDIVPEILNRRLGVGNRDEIAIFGAGNWGTKMYAILTACRMQVSFLIDNDEEKWNEYVGDRRVLQPEVLKHFKGVLLIMVKDFSEEILLQTEKMCNSALYCVTWKEIINTNISETEGWIKNEE